MFFLNTSIEFIVVDFDYIENPVALLTELAKKTDLYISVLSKTLNEDDENNLQNTISKSIALYHLEENNDSELDSFLRLRPWSFTDVFVSEKLSRIKVANSVAIGTVFLNEDADYNAMKSGCDFVLNRTAFSELLDHKFRYGNLGELIFEPARELLPGDKNISWALNLMRFRSNHPEFENVYVLGRFLASADPFLKIHIYSRFIKVFKVDPNRFRTHTSSILDLAIKHIIKKESLGDKFYIVYVPAKPLDIFDRNLIMLKNLQADKNWIYTDGLKCTKQFQSQKDVKGAFAKRENVRGAFEAIQSFAGRPVLLLDDVYTSGSTQAECAKVLLEAGAVRVIPVSLGLFCPAAPPQLLMLTCDTCGSHLDIQFGKKNGNPLWGCKNYNDGRAHSRYFYAEGLRKLRKIWSDAENDKFPL